MTDVTRGRRWRRLPGTRLAAGALCAMSGSLLAGCTDMLTVENPAEILENDLRDPNALPVLVNGVVGDFANAYGQAIIRIAHFANEIWHTGSMSGWREINSGIASPTGQLGGGYNTLVKANWVADNAADLMEEFLSDAGSRPELARVRIYAAFAQLMLADNYCLATINGGPALEPRAVYEIALGHFNQAISVANSAGNAALRLNAVAGRARTHLMLGDWQAARNDALEIPSGWRFDAVYSNNSSRENNPVPGHTVARFRKEAGVDPRFFNDERYATDPRLAFINGGPTVVGEDRIRQFVEQTKYPDRDSPATIASWQEARLIEAEAEVRLGNLTRAIELIDEIRAAAPLPPYDGPATEAAVLEQIFFERSVELYLEAKHLADLRRSNSPLLNGRDNCAPISWEESESNMNLKGR